MKVLLVDDSRHMRLLQKDLLKSLDITDVLEAGSGEEALRILFKEAFKVDCVILDINMPGLSGLDILKAIRERDNKISVIVCSGVSDMDRVKEIIMAGANDYLLKPFVRHDLLARITAAGRSDREEELFKDKGTGGFFE
ncbi:MAG: response regulator [Lentisphaeraceae bacterium]|nr:response regulator [Lentisphaeraceae bacterium]